MPTDLYIWSLLNDGDWACAHGDGEALARVCEQVCNCVGDELARRAHRIAQIAQRDADSGTTLWADLADELRGQVPVMQE